MTYILNQACVLRFRKGEGTEAFSKKKWVNCITGFEGQCYNPSFNTHQFTQQTFLSGRLCYVVPMVEQTRGLPL